MEKAYLGFEFANQMEFLWHMKMARNAYTLSAAGANIFWLDGEAEIGTIIRHTGGGNFEVGFDETGVFTYGAVIDIDTELKRVLVKILGECRVKCREAVQVGMYAEAQADGTIKGRMLDDIISPSAIIGVCSSTAHNGFCKIVMGPGRECGSGSPVSGNFAWRSNKVNAYTVFSVGTLILPNLKISGPFCSGFEKDAKLDKYYRAVVKFDGEFYKEPPLVFTTIVETTEQIRVSTVSETDKLTMTFYRNDIKINPATIEDGHLNIICIGVAE